MKLKKIKKHVKKVKITMKFDSIEAANAMYERLQSPIDEMAMAVCGGYIGVERFEKKPKLVITASGRGIMNKIL